MSRWDNRTHTELLHLTPHRLAQLGGLKAPLILG